MRFTSRLLQAGAVILALAGCTASHTETAATDHAEKLIPASCTVADIQKLTTPDATIVSATPTAAPAPHCRVEGYVTTNNPGPNKVNFRLQLPDENWTGRYYFIGMGATAGFVPSDSQIPAGNPVIKGFAVAGTDTGHSNKADWSFIGKNPAQGMDHIHRGAHVVALATQKITREYYNKPDIYRYHSGCSGGGRMGMEAITRYPEDYDGFLIGAPGMGPTFGTETMLAFIHLGQQMSREPGAWLSPQKLMMLDSKVTQACDALDGAKDDMIWDHAACKFDFDALACADEDGPECLTAPELRSVKAILKGPQGPNAPIKDGFPISNMSVWSGFIGGPPPWPDFIAIDKLTPEDMRNLPVGYAMGNSLGRAYFGDDFNGLKEFDFNNQAQIDDWMAAAHRVGFGVPYTTDISPFQKLDGKVVYWNGVSDPCCLDQDLESYFNQMAEKVGGKDKRDAFSRFYKIPGMAHCGGGTGPQDAPDLMLNALIDWVEKGEAPAEIVTHRGEWAKPSFVDPNTGTVSGVMVPPSTGSNRDFLLCPYPQVARFNGVVGGEAKAENWSCQTPS